MPSAPIRRSGAPKATRKPAPTSQPIARASTSSMGSSTPAISWATPPARRRATGPVATRRSARAPPTTVAATAPASSEPSGNDAAAIHASVSRLATTSAGRSGPEPDHDRDPHPRRHGRGTQQGGQQPVVPREHEDDDRDHGGEDRRPPGPGRRAGDRRPCRSGPPGPRPVTPAGCCPGPQQAPTASRTTAALVISRSTSPGCR